MNNSWFPIELFSAWFFKEPFFVSKYVWVSPITTKTPFWTFIFKKTKIESEMGSNWISFQLMLKKKSWKMAFFTFWDGLLSAFGIHKACSERQSEKHIYITQQLDEIWQGDVSGLLQQMSKRLMFLQSRHNTMSLCFASLIHKTSSWLVTFLWVYEPKTVKALSG